MTQVQISDPNAVILFQIAATLFIKTPDAEKVSTRTDVTYTS